MQIQLPYGHTTIPFDAPSDRIISSRLSSRKPLAAGETLVQEAMRHPIGSVTLAELAVGKKNAVIIISDHTRPVPSRDILPHMLHELRAGSPDIQITLLVATGCHRGTTTEELRLKLGEQIADQEQIVVHDAFDTQKNVQIGILPSGAPLVIDRVAAEADLLLAEGFIEPHFFAGFSGGRKSVLPGICARQTVFGNHCGAFIADTHARTGILDDNPIHQDMVAAARMAGLAYIVNVVINEHKQTVAAFAGDFEQAHEAGVRFLRQYCQAPAIPGDIIVTTNGGAPLDQNLYQCVKGLTAAEATAKLGATIIMCAEMADGVGGSQFYRDMCNCASPVQLYRRFSQTPQGETLPDQWQTQILCRILMRHRVIFVTRPQMQQRISDMKMEYAPTLAEALDMAGSGEITVLPDGVSVAICR